MNGSNNFVFVKCFRHFESSDRVHIGSNQRNAAPFFLSMKKSEFSFYCHFTA